MHGINGLHYKEREDPQNDSIIMEFESGPYRQIEWTLKSPFDIDNLKLLRCETLDCKHELP